SAPGWRMIRRLLRPLEVVNAGLDSPPTSHRRRAKLDVIAVLLVRSAELNRTFWGWTRPEWVHRLGRDQAEFRRHATVWAGDEVRPLPRGASLSVGRLQRVSPAAQLPAADLVVEDLRTRSRERRDHRGPRISASPSRRRHRCRSSSADGARAVSAVSIGCTALRQSCRNTTTVPARPRGQTGSKGECWAAKGPTPGGLNWVLWTGTDQVRRAARPAEHVGKPGRCGPTCCSGSRCF
ncbi:MAG: hypothetical protein QOI10_4518, partial [Solirubrobacterales bacterium]|nr:hypothetical protein [Solirubrobacterales bacterium]